MPSPFGALILKAAAYQTDSRDKERHLQDAAFLLAVIEDPLCGAGEVRRFGHVTADSARRGLA